MIANLAAYRFVSIADPGELAARLRDECAARSLLGTVLVAEEGINLFLAGARDQVEGLVAWLRADSRFTDIDLKWSDSEYAPFKRLRVKRKRQIIPFPDRAMAPSGGRAPTVSPEALARWIAQGRDDRGRELVLLDTRNRQEVAYGTFDGAMTLPIDRFMQLPEALASQRAALHGKTVVSFCTGGIRCEKAALWMREAGYGDVLQLEGGILGYFERVGGQGYRDACFVFDERVALDTTLAPIAARSDLQAVVGP